MRLDDPAWREALLAAGAAEHPRAIFLDPLVRLKGAEVDENTQPEGGPGRPPAEVRIRPED